MEEETEVKDVMMDLMTLQDVSEIVQKHDLDGFVGVEQASQKMHVSKHVQLIN